MGITIMKSTVLMNCIAASVNKISPARSTPLPSGRAGSAAEIGATVLLAFTAGAPRESEASSPCRPKGG